MRSRKWKDKEFSTETLTQIEVDEIMAGSEDYDRGKSPVTRNTQYAQDLDDMAKLQKISQASDELKNSFTLQPLSPEDENYDDIMENYDDITEKMASNPTKPKYWFKEQGDHWFCSCGQLNKGDVCESCGLERDLLRALFFLHEPGDEPGRYEGMDIRYTDVDMPKGPSPKAKLIIAIVIIIALVAGAAAFAWFMIIKPSMEEEAEATATAAAESIETNVALFTNGTESFLRDSYITAGDNCLENGDYEQAIRFYGMAQSIKDSDGIRDKIDKAKYEYVLAHREDGGDRFEKYLNELYKADYPEIAAVYNDYYAWHTKIVCNLSADDYSSDISTASRSDIIYFHVSLSGGPPEETLDVYYKAKYPSGKEEIQQIGSGWKSGSKGTARCMYAVPLLGKEGKLTFSVYDKSTNELLGSDSVTLSK